MEFIEIFFKYKNIWLEAQVYPQEKYTGLCYPVYLNGSYSFTICFDDELGWKIISEEDGTTPAVEKECFSAIATQLKWELSHAA